MFRPDKWALKPSVFLSLLLFFGFGAYAQMPKSPTSGGFVPPPDAKPVLWTAPTDIKSENLFWGPGGEDMQPDISNLTFIRKEQSGYSTKYRVKDAKGRVWVAKVGNEAQPETVSVRLTWAIGYVSEINYLVPQVTIPGVGTFQNVRFEARPDNVKRVGEWDWKNNPFAGTQEFQGLKAMMQFLNNWDIKDANNVKVYSPETNEIRYTISDLGATLGKTGGGALWRFTRSRNNPKDFAAAKFISKVNNGHLVFANAGKESGMFGDITPDQAKWLGDLLAQLSDDQLRDALKAANYNGDEVDTLMGALKYRIQEMQLLLMAR
jgi:hypothetical protein